MWTPVEAPRRRKGRTILLSEFQKTKKGKTFKKLSFLENK
jgi:hypothetical protein